MLKTMVVHSQLLSTINSLQIYATGTGSANGTNNLENAVNTSYANDCRAANNVAGSNYLASKGRVAVLTNFPK